MYTLNWHAYAELARSTFSTQEDASGLYPHITAYKPFSDVQPALTQRQQEVAALALRRFTNHEIAQTLGISEHTVEKHMASIMGSLGFIRDGSFQKLCQQLTKLDIPYFPGCAPLY